jgi:hypothetical protein
LPERAASTEANAALGGEGILAGIAELVLTGVSEIRQAVNGGVLEALVEAIGSQVLPVGAQNRRS